MQFLYAEQNLVNNRIVKKLYEIKNKYQLCT